MRGGMKWNDICKVSTRQWASGCNLVSHMGNLLQFKYLEGMDNPIQKLVNMKGAGFIGDQYYQLLKDTVQ